MPRLFGEKLRRLRSQDQMTQTDLGRRLGLASHTHINNLEFGRRTPSLDLVLQVANIFSVRTDYLLRDTVPTEAVGEYVYRKPQTHNLSPRLFGPKFLHLRMRSKMTQNEVAHRLALASRSYISNLEAGRKIPAPDLVPLIADLFDVTTDYLLNDSIPDKI